MTRASRTRTATLAFALAAGVASTALARPLEREFPLSLMTCWEARPAAARPAGAPQPRRIMLVHYPTEWKPDAEGRFELLLKVSFRDPDEGRETDEDPFETSRAGLCAPDGLALACRAVGAAGRWRVERSVGGLTLKIAEPVDLESRPAEAREPKRLPAGDWRLESVPYGACEL